MAPNYGHVRTNWVTCDLPCLLGTPHAGVNEGKLETDSAPRSTTAECVFLTASQISSGTLSVPAKRAEAIFSLPCTESDDAARIVVATEHVDEVEDCDGGGDGSNGGAGGTSNVLIPIREPFSPSKVEGQAALPPSCMTPLTHTIRDDNKVVVWDSSASNGYLVKLRKFASQPTQVFLNGLYPLFDGLKVTARCVVCFIPTGVLGHAQAVVGYAGAVDGLYARVRAGVVHEWAPSGVWKGTAGAGILDVRGLNRHDGDGDGGSGGSGGSGDADTARVRLAQLQRVLRVQTVADTDGRSALQMGREQNNSSVSYEVAVVDARFGCFLRNVDDDVEGLDAGQARSPRVIVVDSCALTRAAYLRRRAEEGSDWPHGEARGTETRAKNARSRAKRRLGRADNSENGPEQGSRSAKHAGGVQSSKTLSSERRAFGAVNEHRMALADDGQSTKGSTTLILKQRRNARKASKPSFTL